MKLYPLKPYLRSDLWGGERLFAYGKENDAVREAGRISESWELSFTKGGEATLLDGTPLPAAFDKESYGARAAHFPFFPVLTKFIDAKQNLSVQVHPSDEYALKNEGQFGKCEMWYILEAEEGAGLYLGFERETTAEQVRAAALDGTVESLLHFQPVKPGEVYFIPPGTVHAIGAGVLLFEIQQNSTLTYRLYDYKRKDKDGNERPLHLEKGLLVTNFSPYKAQNIAGDDPTLIGSCSYFQTRLFKLNFTKEETITVSDSFVSLTCVRGEGTVNGAKILRGESLFIPAESGELTLAGEMEILAVSV